MLKIIQKIKAFFAIITPEKITAFVAVISLLLGIYNLILILNPPDADILIVNGNEHFDKGEYNEAVKHYNEALKIQKSDANVWKKNGLALFNLGIDKENASVKRHNRSSYSYAKNLIIYYDNHTTEMHEDYLERSYQSFENAVFYNPKDPELWLYKGITCLYLSPSTFCNPIEDFDNALEIINRSQISYPLRDIESYALYGKGMTYLKIKQNKILAEEYFKKANEK